jgi:hypothetical protein
MDSPWIPQFKKVCSTIMACDHTLYQLPDWNLYLQQSVRTRSFTVIVSVNHKAITVFAVGWKWHLILLSVLGHAHLLFILKKRALWFGEGELVVIQRLLVCTFHWLVSGHCCDESHKWSVAGAMLQALLSHLTSLLAAVHSNVQKNIKIDKSYPRPTHI